MSVTQIHIFPGEETRTREKESWWSLVQLYVRCREAAREEAHTIGGFPRFHHDQGVAQFKFNLFILYILFMLNFDLTQLTELFV